MAAAILVVAMTHKIIVKTFFLILVEHNCPGFALQMAPFRLPGLLLWGVYRVYNHPVNTTK